MTSPGGGGGNSGGFMIGQAFVQVVPLMAGFNAKLIAEVAAASKLAGAAGGSALGGGVKKGATEAEAGVKSLTGRMGEFTRTTLATGGPIKALGVAFAGAFVIKGLSNAIKDAKEFQLRLVDLHTGAGEAASNLGMISSGLKTMSTQTGVTAINLEKALYTIESDGYHGAKGLAILKAAAEGARTGLADVTTVAQSVMTVMRSYEIPAERATAVTSLLIDAVAHGGVRMNEFAHGMQIIGPIAAALHVPMSQMTGALATVTSITHDASTAATGLRFVMNSLARPLGPASAALESVGLSAEQVSRTLQGPGHLIAAMQLIEKHVGETFPNDAASQIAALHAIVGGTRGFTAAIQLLGPHMQEWINATNSGTAAFNKAGKDVTDWSAATSTFSYQVDVAKARMQAWGIAVGTELLPALTATLKALEDVATAAIESGRWLDHHRAIVVALGLALVALKWNAIISAFETIAIKAMYAGDAMRAFGTASAEGMAAANPILGAAALALGGVAIATELLGHKQHAAKVDVDGLTQAIKDQNAGNAQALPNAFLKQLEDNTLGSKGENVIQYLQRYKVNVSDLVTTLQIGAPQFAKFFQTSKNNIVDWAALLQDKGPYAHNQLVEMIAPVLKDPGVSTDTKQKLLNFLGELSAKYVDVSGKTRANASAQSELANSLSRQSAILGPVAAASNAIVQAQKGFQPSIDSANKALASQNSLLADNRNQQKLTAATLLQVVHNNAVAIVQENANIQKLVREGFSPEIIKQLINAGPQYVAAASTLTKSALKQFTNDWVTGVDAAGKRATTLAALNAPGQYQAVLKAEKAYEASLSTANRRAFQDTVQNALTRARQIADAAGTDIPRSHAGHVTTQANAVLRAYLATLPTPVRTAVNLALNVANQGGHDVPQRAGAAATANRGAFLGAVANMVHSAQGTINTLHGKTVDVIARNDATAVLNNINNVAHQVSSAFAHLFAAGGAVRGGIAGRDSVAALLMPGEHVWTAAEVAAAGGHGAMTTMRSAALTGSLPRFAAGGAVPDHSLFDRQPLTMAGQEFYREIYNATAGVYKLKGKMDSLGIGAGAMSSGAAVNLGRAMAAARGWTGAEWNALNMLWTRESGWNPRARNPSSGAFGIPQALPPGKMGAAAVAGNAGAQIAWGLNYIAGRYGDPINAWRHEVAMNWYDRGGPLMPGWTMAYNGTGKPETVVPAPPSALAAGPKTVNHNSFTIVLDKSMSYPEMVADVQRRLALAVAT